MYTSQGEKSKTTLSWPTEADAATEPRYRFLVPVRQYALAKLEASGDATVAAAGFPLEIPGWGAKGDYSVYIDGPRKTTLASLRARCLARGL